MGWQFIIFQYCLCQGDLQAWRVKRRSKRVQVTGDGPNRMGRRVLSTRKEGAEALPDPVSVTAVSKGILKLVSKGTLETGATKLTVQVSFLDFFFGFDTDSNGHPIDNGKPTSALRLVNSERH